MPHFDCASICMFCKIFGYFRGYASSIAENHTQQHVFDAFNSVSNEGHYTWLAHDVIRALFCDPLPAFSVLPKISASDNCAAFLHACGSQMWQAVCCRCMVICSENKWSDVRCLCMHHPYGRGYTCQEKLVSAFLKAWAQWAGQTMVAFKFFYAFLHPLPLKNLWQYILCVFWLLIILCNLLVSCWLLKKKSAHTSHMATISVVPATVAADSSSAVYAGRRVYAFVYTSAHFLRKKFWALNSIAVPSLPSFKFLCSCMPFTCRC